MRSVRARCVVRGVCVLTPLGGDGEANLSDSLDKVLPAPPATECSVVACEQAACPSVAVAANRLLQCTAFQNSRSKKARRTKHDRPVLLQLCVAASALLL